MMILLGIAALLTSALVLVMAGMAARVWFRFRMRPLSLVLALFLLAVLLVAWAGWLWPGTAPTMKGLWWGSVTILILVDLAAFFLLVAMWVYAANHRQAPAAPYGVVLGAYLRDGYRVGPILASRIDAAMTAADAHQRRATLIFSGGQGFDENLPEGLAMRDYAAKTYAYPTNQLWVEDQSHNTYQNLVFTRQLIEKQGGQLNQPNQLLIFTSDYHVLRAAFLAHRIGLKTQVFGGPTRPKVRWRARLREYLAFLNLFYRPVIILVLVVYALSFLAAIYF
ncbi:YdcF family protein [Leuconostocaceae bacterium ESL0723]|nr:YdcF family protein [Leuconostocaceae bacterium ESL0723]